MDQVFGWLIKLLFIVMLAPFFLCFIVQLFVGLAVAMMPWMLIYAAVSGLFGGIGMALVLRRRVPVSQRGGASFKAPPSGQHRVRRPKSGRREED